MKRYFKPLLPHFKIIRNHPRLQFFGSRLRDPNLWHLNRHSVSGGMAVGVFCAFLPIPLQMVLAAGLAILMRVNLPLSVLLVWTTNPITIPPLFYLAYRLGYFLMDWVGYTPRSIEWQFSMTWLFHTFNSIWHPLLLGSLMMGLLSAFLVYFLVRMVWRLQVIRQWRERRRRALTKTAGDRPAREEAP